ncbi:MAG: hypothetical protein D6689_05695 [Deltaproteobacteria bacterium]|nr:MAG: hypothetical protein D6689_05695 [Deltaproteobacteria bacterium]
MSLISHAALLLGDLAGPRASRARGPRLRGRHERDAAVRTSRGRAIAVAIRNPADARAANGVWFE